MERIRIRSVATCQLTRPRSLAEMLDPRGVYTFEHIRDGKIIRSGSFPNVVTVEGKNWMLDTLFNNGTNLTVWYMGLIDAVSGPFGAVDEDDIYDNIDQAANDWDEFQDYTYAASSVNRGTWDVGAASSKQVTSATQTQFDIVAPGGTIKGAFICAGASAQTKGDHTAGSAHKLFSASVLSGGDVVVANSDTFKMTYTITT